MLMSNNGKRFLSLSYGRLFLVNFLLIYLLSACGQGNVQDDYTDNYVPNEKAAEINLKLGIEYMRLGQENRLKGDYKRERDYLALAHNRLIKAVKMDEKYADAQGTLAVLYERLNLDDKAQSHYQAALKLKPKNSVILNNYGQFLCEQGEWDKAREHFLRALENPVYPTPEIPYTNIGLCALHHNFPEQAEHYFQQALEKNPNFARALYQMALLNYDRGLYLSAHNYLQRYSTVAVHTPATLWLGIRVERALGNREAEANYVLLLHKNFPNAPQIQWLNSK
jgi:type IV pilus assembly protein PilF